MLGENCKEVHVWPIARMVVEGRDHVRGRVRHARVTDVKSSKKQKRDMTCTHPNRV